MLRSTDRLPYVILSMHQPSSLLVMIEKVFLAQLTEYSSSWFFSRSSPVLSSSTRLPPSAW